MTRRVRASASRARKPFDVAKAVADATARHFEQKARDAKLQKARERVLRSVRRMKRACYDGDYMARVETVCRADDALEKLEAKAKGRR